MSTAIHRQINQAMVIKYLITFGLPVIIFLLPKTDVYTREMAIVIAATFCFLAWAAFELTNLFVPAVLWPSVLILTKAVTYTDVYGAYVGSTIPGMAGILILATTLERIGLLKRLAFFVARKFGGSFTGTVYSVFAATLSIAVVTFACGDVIAAAVAYGAVKAFRLEKTSAGAVVMMAGMLGAITMRLVIYAPVFLNPMMESAHGIDPDFTITPVDVILYNWPVIIFCVIFIWLMIKLFVKKDAVANLNSKAYYDEEYAKLGKMSNAEKVGTAVLLFIMLSIFTYDIHGLDYMYAFVIGMVVMYLFGYATNEDIFGCSLPMLFFFASCMAIGSVCGAVGITSLLKSLLTPLLAQMGSAGILIATLFLGFGLNFCMTPMAMCAGLSGMVYDLFVSVGLNPMAGLMTFYHSTDLVLLPYEFISFLIFFGYGVMSTKDFVKCHALKSVCFLIFYCVVFIPYWLLLGLV